MNTASVAHLKQNLSRYLREMEAGGEVIVTSHHRPVARLVPTESEGLPIRLPTRSLRSLATLARGRQIGRSDVVALLVEERQRR